MALEAEAYPVTETSSAEAAIEILNRDSFPIVISDIYMGAKTGLDVLHRAKALNPRGMVILMSGKGSIETVVEATRGGAWEYLSKPFSLAQLRQVLKNAVEAYGLSQAAQDRLRERLGHAIKLLRVARAWSLKELAAQTRLSVSQISAIERGTNLPSIESLLAICRAFDKKPSDILASIDF